jgi:hypothetical protein
LDDQNPPPTQGVRPAAPEKQQSGRIHHSVFSHTWLSQILDEHYEIIALFRDTIAKIFIDGWLS